MPVAAQVRPPFGDHYEMALSDLDEAVTSGAQVALASRIRLHRCDDLYPVAAHSTSAAAMRMVPITSTMSTAVRRCWRKGLKPMAAS